jgi:hypothetical protein
MGISQIGELTKRYSKGETKKIIPEIINNFFLPILSDNNPMGKLNNIPANGEKAAIRPINKSFPPKARIYNGSTGLLEMVVENIAKKPINDK